MNTSENYNLDDLLRKTIKKTPLTEPSANFTSDVMRQINSLSICKSTKYEPLISIKMWLFIVVSISVLIALILYSQGYENSNWLSLLLSKSYINSILSGLSFKFTLSRIFIYGFICFALMFFIQISMIKYYFEKSLKH